MRRTVIAALALLTAAACSPLGPRRLKLVPAGWAVEEQAPIKTLSDTDVNPRSRSPQARSLGSSSWEHYQSFDVGIVEFNEHGNVWSSEQRDQVLRNVRQIAETTGATIVVYVHGWHHSARWNDTNLVSFRRVLRALARQPVGMSCTIPGPKRSHVVGVYIGWRGESLPVPGANLFTIWSRKKVAQRIGGAATDWEERQARYQNTQFAELLLALNKIHDDANRIAVAGKRPFTSLVITGHSLGGAMLLSTMQRVVFNATIDRATVGTTAPPRSGFRTSTSLIASRRPTMCWPRRSKTSRTSSACRRASRSTSRSPSSSISPPRASSA